MDEARDLTQLGYEPIECAFGHYGSVLGPLAMDHHGSESHRQGVAIRACGEHFAARRDDLRFVVTGTPDADAVLAIIALGGLVEPSQIPTGFPELVDRHDTDPIGFDLTAQDHGGLLLAFNQTHLARREEGFRQGIERMLSLLVERLTAEERERAIATERARQRQAEKALVALFDADGFEIAPASLDDLSAGEVSTARRVVLVQGRVWGFDVWYTWAPVVVSYSSRLEKITLGCPNKEAAERLFGEGGLFVAYRALGEGWGGREAVGGSPRGERTTLEDATEVARKVAEML